jgi:hypothetical protein
MRAVMIAGMVLALGLAVQARAEDQPVKPKIPPAEVNVKVNAPDGTSEQDIAAAIKAESDKRDPAAQHAAQVAKHKADEDAAHAERVAKVCDSIPEKAMRDDPSLRKMCQPQQQQ